MKSDELVKLYWKEIGDKVSYELKLPHILNLHAVIGACLNSRQISVRGHKLDLRVHPFIIRASGSGKALSYDLAENLAKKVGLDWRTRTKITEAGLIGTLRQTKNGCIPIYGDAYESDILGFTEANILLSETSKFDTLRDNINTIMDSKGVVHKRLAIGTLEYETRVSLVLSSYPSATVYDAVKTGFLPRCFFYYEHVSLQYYMDIIKWLAQGVGIDNTPDVDKDLNLIAKQLKEVREFDFKFTFNAKVKKMLEDIRNELEKIVLSYQIEDLNAFTTRYFNLLCKLSAHSAALELRNDVNAQDIEYAKNLVLPSLKSVAEFLKEYVEKDKAQTRLEKQLNKFKKDKVTKIKLSELARKLRPLKVDRIENLLQPYEIRGELSVNHDKRVVTLK